jgi:hypothetical protein
MLTPAQCTTLKALAMADQTAAALIDAGNDIALADWFNTQTANYIWRSSVPVDEVFDAITWANLTPVDVPDGSAAYTNRALLCQAKQINLQILLQGRERVAAAKAAVRGGLSDALLNVPSGVAGATQSAGWAAVKSVISRLGTRAEMALASGAGTQAAPSTPAFDGQLGYMEMPAIKAA